MGRFPKARSAAPVIEAIDDVLAVMRSHDHRSTHPRRTLIQIFFETPTHLSAEELTSGAQSQARDVSKSTWSRARLTHRNSKTSGSRRGLSPCTTQ